MKNFKELKKNLKKDFAGFKKLKIALLGDSATQFLNQTLKACAFEYELELDIWEADFNQIERQILDHSSELYAHDPEIVIVFHSSQKLLNKYNKMPVVETSLFAQQHMELVSALHNEITSHTKAKFIYYNFNEIDDNVFGNYSCNTESSFLFQLRKINYQLMVFASQNQGFYMTDISSIQNLTGRSSFFSPSIYVNTDMTLSIDSLPIVCYRTMDLIGAMQGKFKKCLILDLDNTTWGGVIGDDGMENIQIGGLGIGKAFTELQYWAKKLKNRGIILCVCSKNTESVAKEPFEEHPDMVLRLDDIAVFVANWESKVNNIRYIQEVLNIGFDSMVFLDDNPFERNIVRENIADIIVPELPEDPAEYLPYIYSLNLFETISYSSEDAERTKKYQEQAKRSVLMKSFKNEDDFLSNLNMVSVVEPFTKFTTPRVAQLSQRSNQFNLRTKRYTESDIQDLANSDKHFTFTFTLEDKFGNNGLICVIILEKESEDTVFIDTWLMSCRVLKRGMENFTLNCLADFASDKGFKFLKGEYLETPKNGMVKEHYKNLGFESKNDAFILDLDKFNPINSWIRKK